jgi:hypothetical protein
MPNMSSAHFDNAAVTGATNPSAFGYHHGEHMQTRVATHTKHMQAPSLITTLAGSLRVNKNILTMEDQVRMCLAYVENTLTNNSP